MYFTLVLRTLLRILLVELLLCSLIYYIKLWLSFIILNFQTPIIEKTYILLLLGLTIVSKDLLWSRDASSLEFLLLSNVYFRAFLELVGFINFHHVASWSLWLFSLYLRNRILRHVLQFFSKLPHSILTHRRIMTMHKLVIH
jgi:hypothetical protein